VLVCLGPNPAVDRTALVEALEPNEILRPIEVVVLPGGKALCAARAARALGVPVGVGLIVGGHAGRWLVEASEREGLGPLAVESGVETRTTYVVVDRRARQIAVYEPSAAVSPAVFEAFLGLVASRLLPTASWVIPAGSLPTGIAPDGYAAIVEECRRAGRPCLVDTSGDALRAAVAARPTVVKVSLPEAQAAGFGGLARDAAGAIAAAGAEVAVVTDGARGAVATDGRRLWRVVPPRIRALCAVGERPQGGRRGARPWGGGRGSQRLDPGGRSALARRSRGPARPGQGDRAAIVADRRRQPAAGCEIGVSRRLRR